MNTRVNSVTEGGILGPLVLFSLPILGANLLQNLYNMVDSVVAGQYMGDHALAAIGSTAQFVFLIVGFFLGVSTGAGVKISTAYGAEDWKLARKTMANALLFSVYAGLVATVILSILIPWILKAMLIPADIYDDTLLYMRIYLLSIPAIAVYNTGAAILRAVGDSKRPMLLLAICGVTNLIMDIIFVVIFGWGVAGIAWATLIAQAVSAVLILYMLMRRNDRLTLEKEDLKLDLRLVLEIFKIGLPVAMQYSMISLANVVFQSQVNVFGSVAVAGDAAGNRLTTLLYMPCSALGSAAMTFVGQNVGAKKHRRINRIALTCFLLSLAITVSLSIALFAFNRPFIRIFTQEEPAMAVALLQVTVIGLTSCLWTFSNIFGCVITGLGKSFSSMLITLINMGALRLVWIFLMLRVWNDIAIVYLSYPVTWITSGLCMLLYYRRLYKREIQPYVRQQGAADFSGVSKQAEG